MTVDPRQMMPPSTPTRTPVVGNSLQQLAAMRANSGQAPALGTVRPMKASRSFEEPIIKVGDGNVSKIIQEGAFNSALGKLAEIAQFAKTAKIGYNSSNESLDNNTPQFTYGKLK